MPAVGVDAGVRAWELFIELVREETSTEARRFTERVLSQVGLTRLVDDARLIVTELTTNVLRYVGGPMWLDLEVWPGEFRITVVDAGYPFTLPVGEVDWEELHGRGLLLIQAMATLDLRSYVVGKALVATISL